ncbi:hypothetical protein E2C01_071268 [Portunus trituberculatus]|uniref:Uncharacterized protein n=1 Tax=Portunus trituberculatus TaxID=210409 RepID=A0A5B7I3Y2_PORTR|nr:hypothetical protein [Portunus trituberculatus]
MYCWCSDDEDDDSFVLVPRTGACLNDGEDDMTVVIMRCLGDNVHGFGIGNGGANSDGEMKC